VGREYRSTTTRLSEAQLDAALARLTGGWTLAAAATEPGVSRYALARALAARRPEYRSGWTSHRDDGVARVPFRLSVHPELLTRLDERVARDRSTRSAVVNAALRVYLGATE
jgi:hypothetical protein